MAPNKELSFINGAGLAEEEGPAGEGTGREHYAPDTAGQAVGGAAFVSGLPPGPGLPARAGLTTRQRPAGAKTDG